MKAVCFILNASHGILSKDLKNGYNIKYFRFSVPKYPCEVRFGVTCNCIPSGHKFQLWAYATTQISSELISTIQVIEKYSFIIHFRTHCSRYTRY